MSGNTNKTIKQELKKASVDTSIIEQMNAQNNRLSSECLPIPPTAFGQMGQHIASLQTHLNKVNQLLRSIN